MRKCVIARAAVLAFCAIMVAGVACGAQQLYLTFQDGVNGYTGTMDHSLYEDKKTQDAFHIYESPAVVGYSYDGTGSGPSMLLAQKLKVGNWYEGKFHACLIHFTGALEAWQALPGSPILDSVSLRVRAQCTSGENTRYLECSAVIDDYDDGMWKEQDSVVRYWWDLYDAEQHPYQSVAMSFYETDASYRSGGNPGHTNVVPIPPEQNQPVAWRNAHDWGVYPGYPPTGHPARAGDFGPMVAYDTLEQYEDKFLTLDVTPIFEDWLLGEPCQGFHLTIGYELTQEDNWRDSQSMAIRTHEGALAPTGDPTHAPKLTIAYHYEGSATADAGENQGSPEDTNKRVKPGEDIILDGSGSTPLITEYPIELYQWSWTYGTATHYLESTNDQPTAQLPMIVTDPDNVSLTVTDGLGLMDTDTTQIKVTPRIPGDIDGSGKVDFADFNILKTNYGVSN